MATNDGVKITEETRREVSGDRLTDDIGLDDREIAWRKSFTGFDSEDADCLVEMSGMFDDIADELVEQFYANIQSHSEAATFLEYSTKSVEALKKSQTEYLRDLGRGDYGQTYFDRRARIGKIHDMLDLGPKIYLGAYSIYYEGILKGIAREVKQRSVRADGGVATAQTEADAPTPDADLPGQDAVATAVDTVVERTLSALKLLNLDQQVAMDTYIHSYSKQIEEELERREEVSRDVQTAIDELRETSEAVAQSSQQINDLAGDQANRMSDVAGEVSNLSATVEEIASTANDVESVSTEAETLATDGRESANDAIDVMASVDESATDAAADVDRLKEQVDEIDEIVEVINQISEQTNLLALNASIEAARAGEAGEGFAVVANEVKSLAEESKIQSGRIEEMINEIQTDTEGTVESLERTTEVIDDGIDQVRETMDNLTEIVGAVQKAAKGIQEVSAATDDQAASTEEVASMVDKTVNLAQEVSDEIEQVAAANEEQTAKVNEINQSVRRLTESDDG